jgi:hypothetical protein
MPHQNLRKSLMSTLSMLTTALALSWTGSAQADPNPYYIGASTSVGYDSNVFRLPKAVGDTTYSYGLLGGFDQPIGRQRLYANGTVRETRFADLKELNYTNYNALVGIDWQTLYSLSGTLSYSTAQSLYNYGGTSTILSKAKNVENRDEIIAKGRWGASSLLSLDASYTRRKLTYSDPAYRGNALDQDGWSLGLTYRPSALLTLGTAARYTQGKYQLSRDFDRYDIDLTGTWVPTGLSTINARLSYGKRMARNGVSELDFKGSTGQLSWAYQPTGKLRFTTAFSHDSGAESGFLTVDGQQLSGVGDNSRLTNTLTLNSTYDLTAKIQVSASVLVSNRSLKNGSLDGNDTLRTASLAARYAVLRNTSLGCNVRRDTRSASGQGSYDFRGSSVSCSAQISLQ